MAVLVSGLLCMLLASFLVLGAEPQEPLMIPTGDGTTKVDLIYELKKAEIIPTVLDSFLPLLTVSVEWENATAKTGNTINPSKTQSEPKIKLLDTVPNTWSKSKTKSPQLTLAMTDPDAPSRDNPEWSEICHWIATDFHLTDSEEDLKRHEGHDEPAGDSADTVSKKDIKPYKPPGPPPKTGKHRYVFVALAPKNGTTAKLHLRKPGDRQHWGFKHEREGLRMWAEEMGLGVVGANFIYAQNDEQ